MTSRPTSEDKLPSSDNPPKDPTARSDRARDLKKNVRGSAVLLFGRGIGVLINLAAQVLLVRALTVVEYGSFAFGLSVAAIVANGIRFGLDRGIIRFVSMHEEREEYGEMAGVISLALALVSTAGIVIVGATYLASPWLGPLMPNEIAESVLLILIWFAPVQAIDVIFIKLLAIFSSPKTLALRRHIFMPALRLIVVGLLILFGEDVRFLAIAWVLASALSVGLSAVIVARILRKRSLLSWFRPRAMVFRTRQLLHFSVPLMTTDFALVARSQLVVFLLGVVQSASAVAIYRAVQPVARLNVFIFESFKTLFVPAASRMYARGDKEGIGELYWQACAWILLFTFPVFLVTFVLAEPLTVLLFGDRYVGSSDVLSFLSLGIFLNAVAGTNTLSLQVVGRVRMAVMIDAMTLVLALIFAAVLIPSLGALGGALANCITLILRNAFTQWVLLRERIVGSPTSAFVRTGTTTFVLAVGLFVLERLFHISWVIMLPLVVVSGAITFFYSLRVLDIDSTFPELRRIPLMNWLVPQTQTGE